MALIQCGNCSAKISSSAEACPKCGHSNKTYRSDSKAKKSGQQWPILSIGSVIGILAFGTFIYINFSSNTIGTHNIQLTEDKQERPKIRYTIDKSDIAKKLVIAVDIKNPTTHSYSIKVAQKYPGNINVNQIANIYKNVKNEWKYVNDPSNGDYFSKASESIRNNLAGDCDDFAILMSALVSSIGGKTRISFAFANGSGHAYTEVKIASNLNEFRAAIESIDVDAFLASNGILTSTMYYRTDSDGSIWMNLDWTSPHIGGEYYKHRSITTLYPLSGYYVTNDPDGSKKTEKL